MITSDRVAGLVVTTGANLESTMAAVAVHMILPKVKHVNLTFKKAIKKIRGKTFEEISQDAIFPHIEK